MNEIIVGLLRHGQTDWNVEMRLQGISDIPLNSKGREQAEFAGPIISKQAWDILLSSPLSRALETAHLVSKSLPDLTPIVEKLLLERSFGVAEGLTYDQWREEYGAGSTAPEAESIDDLTARADALLSHFAEHYRGKRVLAVSHGAMIRRVIHQVSGGELPLDGQRFGNASLSTIYFDGTSWKILDFNPAGLAD